MILFPCPVELEIHRLRQPDHGSKSFVGVDPFDVDPDVVDFPFEVRMYRIRVVKT